jgi:DNA-binding NtrC family response regulator
MQDQDTAEKATDQAAVKNGKAPELSQRTADGSLRIRVREAARQIESEIIRQTLEQNRWNRRRTAKALRISYRSLMYKMRNSSLREQGAGSQAGSN